MELQTDASVLPALLGICPGVTAVIGSGGKTALLRTLGTVLAAKHRRVVLTTTTKIRPFGGIAELLNPAERELEEALAAACADGVPVCAVAPGVEGKRAAPLLPMKALSALAEYVLVEADGSRGLPLKAHAPHEPVIPPSAVRTVCVVGASGFGQSIAAAAHRPERYAALCGAGDETVVTPALAARVLRAESLADIYYVNQTESPAALANARALAAELNRPVVCGSLWKGEFQCLW